MGDLPDWMTAEAAKPPRPLGLRFAPQRDRELAAVDKDVNWTWCTKIAGQNGVAACYINGWVSLRGEVIINCSTGGSWTKVVKLPDGVPPPSTAMVVPCWGIDTGVSYRTAVARIDVDGVVSIAAPNNKTTATNFDGIHHQVF